MSDDDKSPMLEHEVDATAALESVHGTRAGAVKYRRSSALLLAAITLILFVCALVFLVVSLIVPIFHSLDLVQAQRVASNTSDAAAEAHHHARHS